MRGGLQVFVCGVALVAVTLAGVATAAAQEPAPAQPAAPRLTFDSNSVIWITVIKGANAKDFEEVLKKVQESLQKSEKAERKQQAASWKVYKQDKPLPDGNSVYIFVIDPVVKGQEYDMSMLMSEVFPTTVREYFEKYKAAFVTRAFYPSSVLMTMGQ